MIIAHTRNCSGQGEEEAAARASGRAAHSSAVN